MNSIDVISIPVTDQQRAKEFYSRLGFTVLDETPMGNGNTWIRMGIEGCATTITLVTWFTKMPAGSLQGLVLRTEDINADIKKLAEHGVKTSALEKTPYGKFVSFWDP